MVNSCGEDNKVGGDMSVKPATENMSPSSDLSIEYIDGDKKVS